MSAETSVVDFVELWKEYETVGKALKEAKEKESSAHAEVESCSKRRQEIKEKLVTGLQGEDGVAVAVVEPPVVAKRGRKPKNESAASDGSPASSSNTLRPGTMQAHVAQILTKKPGSFMTEVTEEVKALMAKGAIESGSENPGPVVHQAATKLKEKGLAVAEFDEQAKKLRWRMV